MRVIIIHILCSDGKVRVYFMYRFSGSSSSSSIYCYNTLPTIRKRITKKIMRNFIIVNEKYNVDLEIGEKLYKNVFDSFLGDYKAERIFYIYDLVL